jgi:pimeloyl-ACP methyl ester carboxylesterase
MRQQIQLTSTRDGVRLAWARCGAGSTLVKTANWLTHLKHDWDSPVWRHWMEFLGANFSLVRYDERGCGMSERAVDDISQRHWVPDLECVVDAAEIRSPMVLLGISQGAVTAIQYAVAHPERVSRLVLYGGYARGWKLRGSEQKDHYTAVMQMMRLGWGKDNPVFRQAFTGRFIPEGSHEQLDWFNELCRRTAEPDMAVRLLETRGSVDISEILGQVSVPTLVMHGRHDEVIPFSEGQYLASNIPGASFIELDSCNHILLRDETAWSEFRQAVAEFTGIRGGPGREPSLSSLTRRERQILGHLGKGLSNAGIGDSLHISEKTVRNHLSHLYRKLGVHSRTQALLIARGADFEN